MAIGQYISGRLANTKRAVYPVHPYLYCIRAFVSIICGGYRHLEIDLATQGALIFSIGYLLVTGNILISGNNVKSRRYLRFMYVVTKDLLKFIWPLRAH